MTKKENRKKVKDNATAIENTPPYQLKSLENILISKETQRYQLADTKRKKPKRISVSASEMSALGAYDTISDAIIERSDILYKNAELAMFVNAHEEFAHRDLQIPGTPEGEYKADCYAAYKTGKVKYIRGPFYHRPLNLN